MELKLQELKQTEFPVPVELEDNIAITSLSQLYNWGRRNSLWPMLFGLACCAIEMIATASSRFDFSRFGFEVMRATPRQADLMIVSGTVTKKMVVPIVRLYNQMPEPKYVLAMGACASGGGPFKEGYNVVSGMDKYLPVDVYVPGCPPTPQALLYGMIALQRKIDGQSIANGDDVPWYGVGPAEPTPVPVLGPDIIDPRQMDMIRRQAESAAMEMAALGQRELPAATQMVAAKATTQEAVAAAPAEVDSDALNFVLPTGGTPWSEAEDIREKRRLRALARKAVRATRRAAETDEG